MRMTAMAWVPRLSANWVLVIAAAVPLAAQTPTPPVTPIVPHVETRFGTSVSDDYYWLREKSNPKVIAYLQQENAYTDAMTRGLKPFADALYSEMLAHTKQTDLSVPVRRGDYFYYSRTEEGKQYPIRCRKKGSLQAKEEVLLDLNEIGQRQKVRRDRRLCGQRRPESAGLYGRLRRLSSIPVAGERPAHRGHTAGRDGSGDAALRGRRIIAPCS